MDLLFPFQRGNVEHIHRVLQSHPCALNLSDMGTGKTHATCGLSILSNRHMFILCPKATVDMWFDVTSMYDLVPLGVSNYEALKNGKYYDCIEAFQAEDRVDCPYIRVIKGGEPGGEHLPVGDVDFEWNLPPDTLIVIDEAHKGKNNITINSRLVASTRKAVEATARPEDPSYGVKIVLLSATITDTIECFRTPAYLLGIAQNDKHAYRAWIKSLEAGKRKIREVKVTRAGRRVEVTREETIPEILHRMIIPEYGHRMRIQALMEAGDDAVRELFKENDVQAQVFDITEEEERIITEAYHDIFIAMDALKTKQATEVHPLTMILRARQRIELVKVPTFVMQAMEYLWSDHSVGIFVNFTKTADEIFSQIDDFVRGDCDSFCTFIRGGQTPTERKYNKDAFNDDKSRLLIANIEAGGLGLSLDDRHGNFPRVALISPPQSSSTLKQVLGRMRRAGSRTKTIQRIIYCRGRISAPVAPVPGVKAPKVGADTSFLDESGKRKVGVEEKMAISLNRKLKTIEWLNNGNEDDLLSL
jgi:hypothetical protein